MEHHINLFVHPDLLVCSDPYLFNEIDGFDDACLFTDHIRHALGQAPANAAKNCLGIDPLLRDHQLDRFRRPTPRLLSPLPRVDSGFIHVAQSSLLGNEPGHANAELVFSLGVFRSCFQSLLIRIVCMPKFHVVSLIEQPEVRHGYAHLVQPHDLTPSLT